jgi:hypothetical protein
MSNGVIYQSSPYKGENHDWTYPSTLGDGAQGNARSEHSSIENPTKREKDEREYGKSKLVDTKND